MKPVEYQNILAVDHLEKGYNYISSKGEEVSCPVLENISCVQSYIALQESDVNNTDTTTDIDNMLDAMFDDEVGTTEEM